MPNNLKLSNAAVNAEANALASLLNNGYLRIYDGTQPTNADTAIGSQVLLAELRFNATAVQSITNGLMVFSPLTQDSSANASGIASWFRALGSDGATVYFDGSVGTVVGGFDLVIATTSIVANAIVGTTSFAYTVNKG